jgi:hypothetical protein
VWLLIYQAKQPLPFSEVSARVPALLERWLGKHLRLPPDPIAA